MLLGLLVVVLVVYFVYQPGGRRPGGGPVTPGVAQSVARTATTGGSILPPSIRLDALGKPGENLDTGRNPFRFGVPPPPPAPPAPAFVPPPVDPGPPQPPPPPPWPPPIQLTLIGFWTDVETETRGASLVDPKTNAQYTVIQGSIVDGRYRVLKIGEQTVTVAYLDGSGQKTLTKR
jgi:hypothetical protein